MFRAPPDRFLSRLPHIRLGIPTCGPRVEQHQGRGTITHPCPHLAPFPRRPLVPARFWGPKDDGMRTSVGRSLSNSDAALRSCSGGCALLLISVALAWQRNELFSVDASKSVWRRNNVSDRGDVALTEAHRFLSAVPMALSRPPPRPWRYCFSAYLLEVYLTRSAISRSASAVWRG